VSRQRSWQRRGPRGPSRGGLDRARQAACCGAATVASVAGAAEGAVSAR
jgi:hypothetical protein